MGAGTSAISSCRALTAADVAELIGTLGPAYEEYKTAIVSNGVDGEALSSLAGDELSLVEALNDLGITKKLHQKVIISKLPLLQTLHTAKAPDATPTTASQGHAPPELLVVQKKVHDIKLEEKLPVSPRALMSKMFLIQGIKLDPSDIKPSVMKIVTRLDRQSACDGVNSFHCFLSYRCAADTHVAEKLYLALRAEGFFPFLDKECLVPGMSWREGFLSGIQRSQLFLPLISRAALAPACDSTIDHSGDMVLLEHHTAFQMLEATDNPAFICPIHVGERTGNNLSNFADFDLSLYADTVKPSKSRKCINATLIFPPKVGPAYSHNILYMFYLDSYCKWNLSTDSLDKGPRLISSGWARCPFERIDATLVFPPGVGPKYAQNVAYMFSGDSYCKWNLVDDTFLTGPRKIKDGFPGYPFSGVDATLVYPPGVGQSYSHNKAYMFHGDSYCRWNLIDDTLSLGPRKIKDGWIGFPFDCIDAVVVYPPGVGQSYSQNMAYMFCGDSYCRWNLTDDTLSLGPRKIKDGWIGYPYL